MAKYTTHCPVCDREYETSHAERRPFCSVGCQFGDDPPPPYKPQDVIGKRLEDLDKWRIIATAEALEGVKHLLERQRELCAVAICDKVPHTACGDLFCPADLARKAPLAK